MGLDDCGKSTQERGAKPHTGGANADNAMEEMAADGGQLTTTKQLYIMEKDKNENGFVDMELDNFSSSTLSTTTSVHVVCDVPTVASRAAPAGAALRVGGGSGPDAADDTVWACGSAPKLSRLARRNKHTDEAAIRRARVRCAAAGVRALCARAVCADTLLGTTQLLSQALSLGFCAPSSTQRRLGWSGRASS